MPKQNKAPEALVNFKSGANGRSTRDETTKPAEHTTANIISTAAKIVEALGMDSFVVVDFIAGVSGTDCAALVHPT